jgi:hypothetical protein
MIEKQTLDKLEAAIEAVKQDLSGRLAELAAKSTLGSLSHEEKAEYERIVCLNDLLSLLKVEADEYWAPRIASSAWLSRDERGYGVERSMLVNTVDYRKEHPFFHTRSTILSPSSIWGQMRRATCACVACAVTSKRDLTSRRQTLKPGGSIVARPYFILGNSTSESPTTPCAAWLQGASTRLSRRGCAASAVGTVWPLAGGSGECGRGGGAKMP